MRPRSQYLEDASTWLLQCRIIASVTDGGRAPHSYQIVCPSLTCIRTHTYTLTYKHIHTHSHTYIHTHIQTHTYTLTHMHTHSHTKPESVSLEPSR